MTEEEFRHGRKREPLRVDLDTLDPHGDSLLDAQRLAAEQYAARDREWQRLRKVEAAAKALLAKAREFGEPVIEFSEMGDELEQLEQAVHGHG
jgi:hypothetical protein